MMQVGSSLWTWLAGIPKGGFSRKAQAILVKVSSGVRVFDWSSRELAKVKPPLDSKVFSYGPLLCGGLFYGRPYCVYGI